MTVTICRVPPALVDHVEQLLGDAGLLPVHDAGADGLVDVAVPEPDAERARSVIGLVLPQLLESGTRHRGGLSDRLIRSEDDDIGPPRPGLPGGLLDARPTFGYADPLAESDQDDPNEYVPPPPPPLPRPADRVAAAAWAAVIGGPLLLVITQILQMSSFFTAVGVAAFIAGFGTLVARMEERRGSDDGWDDGAVV